MSKPIFIIRFPYSEEKREQYTEVLESMRQTLKDYHVFSVMDTETEKVAFECYNPDISSEITLQEFEQRITSLLK